VPAHALTDLDVQLAVEEMVHHRLSETPMQALSDSLREWAVR
jgi:hypothetical protein